MKVVVESHHCIGSGNCAMTAPDVFDQDEERALVVLLDEAPPETQREAVTLAMQRCPAAAILIVP